MIVDATDLLGTLTTEDQKAYYTLVKIWEAAGRPREATFFSLQQLARVLKKKWGRNVNRSLIQSLTRLRTIGIIWTDSYYDNTAKKTKTAGGKLIPFTILATLKIMQRKNDGHVTTASGYFKFDDDIQKNILDNHTKPVLIETVISFKSEIGQMLYSHLDLILADKTIYERRGKELFDDFRLEGIRYRDRAHRRQVLEKACKELQGLPLTTGRIVSAALEQTKDGKDDKIVIRKGSLATLPQTEPIEPPTQLATPDPQSDRGESESEINNQLVISDTTKDQISAHAEDLLKHFYRLFHKLTDDDIRLTSKALDQAISLIANHGPEKAAYIVDYAHQEAPKTKFEIQAFGGILQYERRALAHYDYRQVQAAAQKASRIETEARVRQELQRVSQDEQARENAKAYLAQLSDEEHQALYNQALTEFKTSPFWKPKYTTNSELVTAAVKNIMIKHVIQSGSTTPVDPNPPAA